jgi:predicted small metal-binding protein
MVMVLRCRDIGGYCNWEGRAETKEKLVREALRHASEAHFMKRTQELEEAMRRSIREE